MNGPVQQLEPDTPETDVRAMHEGTDHERNRYVGRSDTAQRPYYEVSIEEPLNIPIRVRKVFDPPTANHSRSPERWLELNLGSVENARKLHEALGKALAQYDEHESSNSDASRRES